MAVMRDLFMSKFIPIATCIICMVLFCFVFLIIRHFFIRPIFFYCRETDILPIINSQVGVGLVSLDGM